MNLLGTLAAWGPSAPFVVWLARKVSYRRLFNESHVPGRILAVPGYLEVIGDRRCPSIDGDPEAGISPRRGG
jgi:hypothetical protein